jgi:hypothetical protein
VLVALHQVDYQVIGLGEFGKTEEKKKGNNKSARRRYVEHQLRRLTAVSLEQAKLVCEPCPEIESLAQKLQSWDSFID